MTSAIASDNSAGELGFRHFFSWLQGMKSVSIQLAQCWFPGLVISNAKILIYFSRERYRSNFIKQHSKNVAVSNYQTADCS